MNFDVT